MHTTTVAIHLHSTAPTGMDTLAGIIVLIIALVAALGLGGLCIMMAFGAIAGKSQLVTSWPMEQEHSFMPFEQQSSSASSKAWMVSLLVGALFFVFACGVYFGVQPEIKDISKDMNMSNLSSKPHAADTPAPAPAPAASPDPTK